jgi:hypothetical protein
MNLTAVPAVPISMNNPAASNPGCYARQLCDCRGPVNREHVVSDSLLAEVWQGEKAGRVHGLTFLTGKTRQDPAIVGIKSLTAKILCTGHNNDLSRFDSEITKLFRAREQQVMAEDRGDPVAENRYVNGDKIERWMLKTLCNGIFSGNFPVPFATNFVGQKPDDQTLKIIFRDELFPAGWGVYVNCGGHHVNASTVFRLAVVGAPEGIVGLRMWMLGCQFTLVLTDDREQLFPDVATDTYRPKKIIAHKTRNATVFSWKGEHTDTPLEFALSDPPPEPNAPAQVPA